VLHFQVMGTVKEASARSSDHPLTSPAPASRAEAPIFQRLVVPLDGSPLAEAVLPFVYRLAGHGTTVVIVRAVPVAAVAAAVEAPVAAQVMVEAEERDRAEAASYLDHVLVELRAAGLDVTSEVRIGTPATVILDVVREQGAELIAMTTHGRTGLGRLVFGSVAEHVLRHATAPVFLVRVSEAEQLREAA
jgi:nucleotide-binding universal stress UspA family protein